MKTIFGVLDKRAPKFILVLALLIILIVSIVHILIGRVVDIGPFYIFSILIASWYGSKKTGISLALLSTIVLAIIESFLSQFSVAISELLLLSVSYVLVFSGIAIMTTNFRNVHRVEVDAADTDSLTGVHSVRSFYVELANELLRSKRYNHAFSLAYLDVDNFKGINDALGHSVGDKLLIEVADCLVLSLRATDIIARLGGDEYACILPETKQEDAKSAFFNATKLLKDRMKKNKWPVSFSVGLVTFENIPDDIKEAIEIADKLMYTVKNEKKDNVAYKVWHRLSSGMHSKCIKIRCSPELMTNQPAQGSPRI